MIEIPLTRGFSAMIDNADYDDISRFNWCENGGYAKARMGKKIVKMHRYLTKCPDGMVVDHINGNKLDNRRSNLQIVTLVDNIKKYHIDKMTSAKRDMVKAGVSFRRTVKRKAKNMSGCYK